MIFDEHSYSPEWISQFTLSATEKSVAPSPLYALETQGILGGFGGHADRWRFESGLGAEVDITETLLTYCGFRLTFANEQVYEMFVLRPDILIGSLPARAKPELFASDQQTIQKGDASFLELDGVSIGLQLKTEGTQKYFAIGIDPATDTCASLISSSLENIQTQLAELKTQQFSLREEWCKRLPETYQSENQGAMFERVHGLIQAANGPFKSAWILDEQLERPGLTVAQTVNIIPAVALYSPDQACELLETFLNLPPLASGAWAASYYLDGHPDPTPFPALPNICAILATLPKEIFTRIDAKTVQTRCEQHLRSFLPKDPSQGLPQWQSAAQAFTPEVTDPSELKQFDLAALLVTEIEALQTLSGNHNLLEAEAKQLSASIWEGYWSSKRKRLVDQTLDGKEARRVTAGGLIPLLWKRTGKTEFAALRQCLFHTDELRAPEGIRQWQAKKEDPIQPPVHPRTQHLFVPLLQKLPGEAAALLSADWHRLFTADPGYSHPETAALQIRLIPYANRINPHLERYPAWVRSMEKHRKGLVTTASIILLLIPAAFSISFALRKDYNWSEETLVAGHAETLVTMGNLPEAVKTYTRLIDNSRIDARLNQYYLSRGDLQFKQENYQEALDDYLKAVELDPIGNLYRARWNLAQAYARVGQYDQAIETIQAFIDEYGEELPSYRVRGTHAITLWSE
ncbi:tetratricopeptide repeat protein [Kiritimatiellota bacterium B12222]|nr:tetratricopeptide repeat protein [Kiritimatiellota bacterium B12222]